MTLDEIKKQNPNTRLVAMPDKEKGLALFVGSAQIDWPDDWPPSVSGEFVQDAGFEILEAV